ncbi:MAG: MBL fold metallo-hydrolase, partial [Acidobacteria bacterium]|nr:MBL fold metallo-hydrolase [Acidobacteriota bacterium]
VDGKKVAFSGDLMHSPGKVNTLYDMQYNYGGSEGVDMAVFSLSRLRELKPELLCPSHGAPLPNPAHGIGQTIDRLSEYYRFETGGGTLTEANRPYAVSPHFIAHHQTNSSFYAIISNSGKAMFIDYGSASGNYFGSFLNATPAGDRIRFVEHNIDTLKAQYGLKSVEVAMPSHMHDDHMNGFPHLIRHYRTRIWCYENMVDIFENPRGHNLGCTLGEPFKVDRAFRHGEKFRWEEFEFEVTHSPGHTEYQMAMFVSIDGARVAFTGDAFFTNPNAPQSDGALRHNLIFRNHVESDSHLKSIRNILDREPNLIAPGHGKPFLVNRSDLLATEEKLRKQKDLFQELVADRDCDFGLDPSWVKIYPYQMVVKPGESARGEIRVQNYRAVPMKMEVALVLPEGWSAEPDLLRFEAPPRGHASGSFVLRTARERPYGQPRIAIAADVMCDGRYLGQITEAVVDLPA